MDTINGVAAWYTTNMYRAGSVGYQQLQRVRWLHSLVRREMSERRDQDAVRNRTRLDGDFSGCRVSAMLRRDLGAVARSACPFAPPVVDDNDNDLDSVRQRRLVLSPLKLPSTRNGSKTLQGGKLKKGCDVCKRW